MSLTPRRVDFLRLFWAARDGRGSARGFRGTDSEGVRRFGLFASGLGETWALKAAAEAGLEIGEGEVFKAEAGKASAERWRELVAEMGATGARDEAERWFRSGPPEEYYAAVADEYAR